MLTDLGPRLAVLAERLRDERGDVPGWVLVTAMTVALVLGVWAIANDQITQIIQDALDKAQFDG
jgi:hypothetical protein